MFVQLKQQNTYCSQHITYYKIHTSQNYFVIMHLNNQTIYSCNDTSCYKIAICGFNNLNALQIYRNFFERGNFTLIFKQQTQRFRFYKRIRKAPKKVKKVSEIFVDKSKCLGKVFLQFQSLQQQNYILGLIIAKIQYDIVWLVYCLRVFSLMIVLFAFYIYTHVFFTCIKRYYFQRLRFSNMQRNAAQIFFQEFEKIYFQREVNL
eukprot:TRINITY_DN6389_c0_g1_i2.p1 TRINITY_DN6389_c0_g1~~TRINITY_DN6389_c0_g1_i2.p1  ORF type:complete len:205 (+),score=8.45 TRINITY_DN6389_c0_g1_i2:390-1004(+)